MDIRETNEFSTMYNFDGNPGDSRAVQKWLDDFKKHHGLIPITRKSISSIAKKSERWTISHLKRAVPLMAVYKPERDSVFVPYFADDGHSPFGCLEVYDYKQLLRWKSFFPGYLHVKSINRFIS